MGPVCGLETCVLFVLIPSRSFVECSVVHVELATRAATKTGAAPTKTRNAEMARWRGCLMDVRACARALTCGGG